MSELASGLLMPYRFQVVIEGVLPGTSKEQVASFLNRSISLSVGLSQHVAGIGVAAEPITEAGPKLVTPQ